MGQHISQDASCCRSEGGSRNCELNLWELSDHPHAPQSLVQIHGCSNAPDFPDADDFDCCRAPGEFTDASLSQPLETLSYTPTRWDLKSTVDVERSQSRYKKIEVHSSRARTQRRSKAWEEWLRAAAAGRTVTLLMGAGFCTPRAAASEDSPCQCQKVAATYYLDRALTKISILLPGDADDVKAQPPITILVDNIKVVCAMTEFMLLSEAMESQLDEAERSRAALIQYLAEDNTPKRVCFLEESESAKDRSIQALTALWLEKRNDHSMWF